MCWFCVCVLVNQFCYCNIEFCNHEKTFFDVFIDGFSYCCTGTWDFYAALRSFLYRINSVYDHVCPCAPGFPLEAISCKVIGNEKNHICSAMKKIDNRHSYLCTIDFKAVGIFIS